MRIIIGFLVIATLGLWGLKIYYLDLGSAPETTAFQIDIEGMRALVKDDKGNLPIRINAVLVGSSEVPSTMVVAGTGFDERRMVRVAYQIVYGSRYVLIDAGADEALDQKVGMGGTFYAEGYEQIQRALDRAAAVLFTHEHWDHTAGVARAPNLERIYAKIHFTKAQLENKTELAIAEFPAGFLDRFTPIEYEGLHRFASGMVLLGAAGHTPGSQMIYVRLSDGAEYLFVGDIVWHTDGIRLLRGRPRAISRLLLGEEEDVVLQQVRALHNLSDAYSDVEVVVSHDGDQFDELTGSGRFGSRFE